MLIDAIEFYEDREFDGRSINAIGATIVAIYVWGSDSGNISFNEIKENHDLYISRKACTPSQWFVDVMDGKLYDSMFTANARDFVRDITKRMMSNDKYLFAGNNRTDFSNDWNSVELLADIISMEFVIYCR